MDFTQYLNNENPEAAMGGAMASQTGGGDYGQMIAQLMASMGGQRANQQMNDMSGGGMPGGPSVPQEVAVGGGGGMPPMPQGGAMPMGPPGGGMGMPQGMPQMGGGMPMGGGGGGMDEYAMGKLFGQLMRGRGQ